MKYPLPVSASLYREHREWPALYSHTRGLAQAQWLEPSLLADPMQLLHRKIAIFHIKHKSPELRGVSLATENPGTWFFWQDHLHHGSCSKQVTDATAKDVIAMGATRNQLLLLLWNHLSVLPPSVHIHTKHWGTWEHLQLLKSALTSARYRSLAIRSKPDEPTKRMKITVTLQTFTPSFHSWHCKLQAAVTYSSLQESVYVKSLGRVLML